MDKTHTMSRHVTGTGGCLFNTGHRSGADRVVRGSVLRHFFQLLALVGALVAHAQTPPIHAQRPRMLADGARIAWMQANHLLPGEFGDTYAEFLYRYENWWINDPQLYLLGPDSTQWTWDWTSVYATNEAEFTVALWRVAGDPLNLKRCRFLARQVIGRLDTAHYATMEWYAAEVLHRQMSAAGMLLLDWCYDDLPVPLRDSLTVVLYGQARAFMQRFILSTAGTSYVSSHNTWNCVYANQNALVLAGAAALTAQQQDTVLQWHQVVYDKWVNGFLPVYAHYRDDDGGWNWGAAYSMWSLVDQYQLFDNMLIATGTDWYNGLPWVQESINQYWYFIQPDGKSIHFGDGLTRLLGDRVIYRHAALFQDPRSLWLQQTYAQPAYLGTTVSLFSKFIFMDFGLPTVAFPAPPLDWWTDKVGWSVSRSSWTDDATLVSFTCAPSKRAAHEHRDNNSFAVFRRTPLLLDAGHYDTYAGTHMRNYYNRSIAHNTILVYDSTEQMTSFGQPAANDGGQIDSQALQDLDDIFLPQNQRGEWVQWASGAGYQLNIADAALSYDPAKLTRFRRRLLFLKPDRLIVLDHLGLAGVGTAQRDVQWIAHFATQPTMSGTLLASAVPGHIETFDGRDHLSTNGEGSVALRTLLPTASNATRIGGAGYAYWVDGADRPPITPVDTTFYTPGNWRIEVRPAQPSDPLTFLHTIRTGTDQAPAQPGGEALVSANTIAVDWSDTLILFAADGEIGHIDHQVLDVPGGRTVQLFVTDLLDGFYCVLVNGILAANTIPTDGHGTLMVPLALASGQNTVEVVECASGVEEPEAGPGLRAYPTPARDVVHVWNPAQLPLDAVLLDMAGRSVCTVHLVHGANVLEVAGLQPGSYILLCPDGSRARLALH